MRPIALALALLFFTVFLHTSLEKDSKLKVVICDVGQGDGIIIMKGSWQAIVDSGPDNSMLVCLGKHIPFWDKNIELSIVTHPQKDHFGGFVSMLDYYSIENLITNPHINQTEDYFLFVDKVKNKKINVINPKKGTIAKSLNFSLKILSQHQTGVFGEKEAVLDPNELSIVTLLTYKDKQVLLTSDIDPPSLKDMVKKENLTNLEILKIPHHGSKNNLDMEILEKLNPAHSVISAGESSYGHPHKETIEMLGEVETKVLITKYDGDVLYFLE